MSPRAAWRLESLGFQQVYDYVAGKADWGAAGLPLEGSAGPRVSEFVRADVPTARLDERIGEIRERVSTSGFETCIVVNEERVVLGRRGRRALRGDGDLTAEQAMSNGPSTTRPNTLARELVERLRKQELQTALVTTSEGRLLGIVTADDLAGPAGKHGKGGG